MIAATAAEKPCTHCGVPQPTTEFRKCRSASDGLQSWCKGCHRAYKKTPKGKALARRYLQGEAGRATQRRRNASPKVRENKRAYKATTKGVVSRLRYNRSEKGQAASHRYKHGPNGIPDPSYRSKRWERHRRWIEANPDAPKAHQEVRRALEDGRLIKPDHCGTCSRTGVRLDAHHHRGYDAPLDVQWLCGSCHRFAHAGEDSPALTDGGQ